MNGHIKESTAPIFIGIGAIALVLANVAALITAIWHDIVNDLPLWVLVDCVASPIGAIRGWLIWFGII